MKRAMLILSAALLAVFAARAGYTEGTTPQVPSAGIAGEYSDGKGGDLSVTDSGNKQFRFTIDVVRGPTAHMGDISGVANLKSPTTAIYADTKTCKETGVPCCRLTFEFGGNKARIDEKDCGYLGGANAFFGGEYLKTR